MSTSAGELAELRAAVRQAIGASGVDDAPTVDTAWRTSWSDLAEIGLPGLCVPADRGGFGTEVAAAAVVARELGGELHSSPFPAIVAAAAMLARGLGSEHAPLVEEILAGSNVPSIAFLEPSARMTGRSGDIRIDGIARLVLAAAEADSFLVVRSGDEMMFVSVADCSLADTHAFDVTRTCADVRFSSAPAVRLDTRPDARAELESLYGVLLAADALGGAERSHARAVSYASQRLAFGTPIGGFQAVQHRLVDHAVTLRGLGLLVESAADAMTTGAPDSRRRALLAQVGVSRRVVHLLHDLVQLTGGVGFTWEYGLHLFERRAHLDARLGGNPRQARTAVAALEAWTAPPPGV